MAKIRERFRDRVRDLPSTTQTLLIEKFSRNMVEEREGLLNSEIKARAWDQHARIIEIELNQVTQDPKTKVFAQPLVKGQVVFVNFIGLGQVLDEPHPAIIWDFNSTLGHVVVIPLSSKKKIGFDKSSIGVIKGLNPNPIHPPKESLVKIGQMTSVSRKSIKIVPDQTHAKVTPLSLSPLQLSKVEDMFRLHYLKEKLLRDVIFNVPQLIPIKLNAGDRTALYRPVTHVVIEDKLYYKCHDHVTMQCIDMIQLPVPLGVRKKLLRNLLSNTEVTWKPAEESIQQEIAKISQAAATSAV